VHSRADYDGPTGLGTRICTAGFASGAPVTGCTAAQLLRSPSFELRRISPWKAGPYVLNKATSDVPAHTGSRMAWLDGNGFTHTALSPRRSRSRPAASTPRSRLNTHTDCPAGPAADTFTVRVLDSSGTVLRRLAGYSNKGAVAGYHKHSFSLARYAGQRVTLKFTAKQTLIGHVTSFIEDDNALHVS